MSRAETGATPAPSLPDSPKKLWLSQLSGILAFELRKALFGRRSLPIYFLTLLPVIILGLRMLLSVYDRDVLGGVGEAGVFYAVVFHFSMTLVVFFGCVFVFTNLFRGEVVDEVLHYYFLTPVRREVLAAGKFVAAWLATSLVFCGMTAVTYLLLYVPHGLEVLREHFLGGPGLGYLLAYLGVTLMACLGYGAVFMVAGVWFRNPVIPAVVVLGWEWLNPFLPSLLKKISVVHYLVSLAPVPLDAGPFALIAEPTSAWVSVPGFILLAAAVLVLSALAVRRMEISYGAD